MITLNVFKNKGLQVLVMHFNNYISIMSFHNLGIPILQSQFNSKYNNNLSLGDVRASLPVRIHGFHVEPMVMFILMFCLEFGSMPLSKWSC